MKPKLEIEVKFFLTDAPQVRQALLNLGAASRGRVFETNLQFDDAGQTLFQRNQLLRLRRDDRCRLTFKSPPAQQMHPGEPDRSARETFKIFDEIEVCVDDYDATYALLNALGFHAVQTYEKYRETFVLEQTLFCMDVLPYGDFLEIEGKKEAITSLSEKLGLPAEDRITANYLEIFERIKEKAGITFSDLSFENFDAPTKNRVNQVLPDIILQLKTQQPAPNTALK